MTRVRHLKKGDTVVALSGANSGKSGKVIEVKPMKGLVKVEGMGTTKRHTKPTQTSPKGGIVEGIRWMPASKFMAASDGGKKLGRVGFKTEGGEKKRVYSGTQKKK